MYEKAGVKTENIALGMPRYLLEPMIRSKGQSLYSEDGKGFGFDEETKAEIVQVIQDCYDLTQEGVFVDPGDQLLWKDNSERALCTGEAAMGMNWSSQFSNFSGYYNQNLEMTTQPLFDDATEKGMYLRPAQFFSVTKDCADPETAAKAISFFINDKESNETLNGERGIPAAKTIREDLKASADENGKKVYDFMDSVVDYCRAADPAEPSASRQCVEVLNNNVNEVMYGQMTAQECVDSWMEQSLEILAK
jgi:multiple sugar transport system substrate-binding protein